MDEKERTKIVKRFIIIYIISFIFINWNDVSWIFNYRVASGLIDDFFTPYPRAEASSSAENYFYSNFERKDSLEIPSIGIYAPIVFPKNSGKNFLTDGLDRGAVYYPGSALPDQNGEIIILGHSAPLNWPKIKYDWVFSRINDLEAGDEVIINLENKRYIYTVRNKEIVKKGEEITLGSSVENFNSLILISCWPPGKDIQRITVRATRTSSNN